MPQFHYNLIGIEPLCDHGCCFLFEKKTVTIYSRDNDILLRCWREPRRSRLWRFTLRPKGQTKMPATSPTRPLAINAHNLPSVCALIHYLHACARFPVRSMWIASIKAETFVSWSGLTYTNVAKYCPVSVDTLKVHMTQTRQGAHSTKPKPTTEDAPPDIINPLSTAKAKDIYVYTDPIIKIY